LIQFVAGLVEDMQMPPTGSGRKRLASDEIATLRGWIDQGAPWPDGVDTPARETKKDFWTFRPARRPSVPSPAGERWARNEIDRFTLARLDKEGLAPSSEADRRTLIRRVTFDLTGLPPTPEEIEAFVTDSGDTAYERLVDRLLASPQYGEHWARYWLDIVHYGETHGYDKDKPRPHAWPYRDYVIRAFNDDEPYSRFVQEQLAGDVLFPNEPDGVVALGFLSAGPWDFVGHVELPESKTDGLIARYNDRDDMVMTTMSTFESLTVHCARCHDHKFDPIPQAEYYGLQAVFAGVDRADRWYDREPATFRKRRQLLVALKSSEAEFGAVQAVVAASSPAVFKMIEGRIEDLRKRVEATPKPGDTDAQRQRSEAEAELAQLLLEKHSLVKKLLDERTEADLCRTEARLAQAQADLAQLGPAEQVFAAAHDFAATGSFHPAAEPRSVHVLKRGEVKQPMELATPGALSCLPGLDSAFKLENPKDEGSRRAALAKWLTDRANLLTRRSIVNRIWQGHFGRGLIDTPNDFGHMGATPTHPELLDWLAYWFSDHGESIKQLHWLILTSATYRQSSADRPEAAKVDADNRYLWRMNRARLDAESLHDSILFVAGQLDETMGGPSVQEFFFKDDHSPVYDYSRFDIDRPGARRRSIYRFIVRSVPDPFMETMDCPDPSLLTAKRSTTVTALQALALLNDPFVLRQAEYFADRLNGSVCDQSSQITTAYQLALGRAPAIDEAAALMEYATHHGMTNLCRVIFNTSEFMFVD
jgi:hypothetical protein